MTRVREVPYVIVNGVLVISKGQHTGAKPGRVSYGRSKATRLKIRVYNRLLDPGLDEPQKACYDASYL